MSNEPNDVNESGKEDFEERVNNEDALDSKSSNEENSETNKRNTNFSLPFNRTDSQNSGDGGAPTSVGGLAKDLASSSIEGTKVGEAVEKAQKAQKLANGIQKLAEGAKASALKITPILVNPIFWIIVAIVLLLTFVIMSIVTATQTFGPLETDCKADGTISVTMPNKDASIEEKQDAMGSWLTSNSFEFLGGKPMSKAQASAVIGNFSAESQLGFDVTEGHTMDGASNEEVDAWTKGGARGLGLAQWTWNPGRAGNLISLAKSMGKNWYDVEVQLEMIKQELDANYGKTLNAAGFSDTNKNAGELATIFHDHYEVSNDSAEMKKRRADSANTFFQSFSGGSYSPKNDTCTEVGTVAASCAPVKNHPGYCYPLEPGGYAVNTYSGHPVEAKDIPGPEGTPLYAFGAGVVKVETITVGGWCPVGGRAGAPQHEVSITFDKPINGANSVLYAHLRDASPLKTGDKVKAGDFVGELGNSGCSTGAHLHIEFTRGSGVNLDQFLDGLTL